MRIRDRGRAAYVNSNGGTTDVNAYIPVTHGSFAMRCAGGSPHVCAGGNNAEATFYANPPTQAQAPSSGAAPDTSGLHDCTPGDPTISVNAITTCKFAARVFIAYWYDWKQNGSQRNTSINAHSPATRDTYPMTCTNDATTIGCMGANSAYVRFPLSSIAVYTGSQ